VVRRRGEERERERERREEHTSPAERLALKCLKYQPTETSVP